MQNFPTKNPGDAQAYSRLKMRACALLVGGTLLAPIAGCDLVASSAVQQSPPGGIGKNTLTVNATRAQLSENVSATASAFGTIEPRRSSSLGFARAGRVRAVFFNVGDFVGEGEKIAELDQGELANQQQDLDYVLKAQNEELELLRSQGVDQAVRRKEEEIEELTTQQQRLSREFQRGYIVAPYRGVIAERNAEVGDAVPAGRPFFRILEADQPIVTLEVPLELAQQVTVGMEVWVKRGEEPVMATVATKAPELSPSSRTQTLTLSLPAAKDAPSWNYGEVVEVQFFLTSERDGYWIPYSALQRDAAGLWSVYVLEVEGDVQRIGSRTVEFLDLSDTHALATGALKPGDLFVVDGLNRVVVGQTVTSNVVPNDSPRPAVVEAGP